MDGLYDPLSYDNLARNVVGRLLDQPMAALAPGSFGGPGVYAIYYTGTLDYLPEGRTDDPVYVGRAEPPGSRKGGTALALSDPSLNRRLNEHERTISQARNLVVKSAFCRYLTVYPVWIPLAERFLLDRFQPVWNTLLDGFGNHDPGAGRGKGARPRWDIVHPGRPWAGRLQASKTRDELVAETLRAMVERSAI